MSNLPAKLGDKTEMVIMQGDLSKLSAEERLSYVNTICESLGLNPLTRPFDYILFQGKLVLYARKDATEQLRKIYQVSITELKKEVLGDILYVTAYGEDKNGKKDVATGALFIGGLKGADLANAMMKCETKAKRRLTLSICGLGMLDETEIEDAKDVTPAKTESLANGFDSTEQEKAALEIIKKFRALGVSEKMIIDRYKVGHPLELEDEMLQDLKDIGGQLVNRKKVIADYFKLQNHAPGAKQ